MATPFSGVSEIHKVFQWAEASEGGLILFIDEAEAFLKVKRRGIIYLACSPVVCCSAVNTPHTNISLLCVSLLSLFSLFYVSLSLSLRLHLSLLPFQRRGDPTMSEDMRSALNALLYNTGTASRKFMLVLATNRPGDLDLAVSDRVDEQLRFDLPGSGERARLLRLFLVKYFEREAHIAVDEDAMADDTLALVAEMTDGMSGRGIEKLVISAQGRTYGTTEEGEEPVLTKKTLLDVAEIKAEQFVRRRAMAIDAEGAGNFV